MLIHDPELLLAVVGVRRRPPVVWDVHEDTPATLSLKPWLPVVPASRRCASWPGCSEGTAERHLHLLLAETAYAGRFRQAHLVVPNETWVPDDGDRRRATTGSSTSAGCPGPEACARPSRWAGCSSRTGWRSS